MRGTAGQSLGVWNAGGLHLELEGDANDFVGKGMAGGRIVVKPAKNVRYETRDAAIIGNTCLYGATGRTLFAAGMGGQSFSRSESVPPAAIGRGYGRARERSVGWMSGGPGSKKK